MAFLSNYASKLPAEAKERYLEKISVIQNIDPFLLQLRKRPQELLQAAKQTHHPPVDGTDLVCYLVLQTSYVTFKQLKAHKSMEAHKQFVEGWIKSVESWSISNKIVVTGRVSYLHGLLGCQQSTVLSVCPA